MYTILQAGLIAGGKRHQRRTADCLQTWTAWATSPTKSINIHRDHKKYTTKATRKWPKTQFVGSTFERRRIKDWHSGRPDLAPLSFTTLCSQIALKKWWALNEMRPCIKDFLLRERLSKLCWKKLGTYNAMKIQNDVLASRNRSRNKKTNSRSTSECKEYHTKQHSNFEWRTSRIPNWRIFFFIRSKTDAFVTDLHKSDAFNPCSEESKRTIHNLGKLEFFELGEVSAKIRCPSCAKYWNLVLHLRKMFVAVRTAKTNDERTVWRTVNTLLRQKDATISRCETWKVSRKIRSFEGKCVSPKDSYRNSQIDVRWTENFGWTEENAHFWNQSNWKTNQYTSRKRERWRYENSWRLSVNGQGPVPSPMSKREDYPQPVTRIKNLRQQAENPSKFLIPLSLPFHSSESSNSTETLWRTTKSRNEAKGWTTCTSSFSVSQTSSATDRKR